MNRTISGGLAGLTVAALAPVFLAGSALAATTTAYADGSTGGYYVQGPNALTEATAYVGSNYSTSSLRNLGTEYGDGAGVDLSTLGGSEASNTADGDNLFAGVSEYDSAAGTYNVGYKLNENGTTAGSGLLLTVPVGDTVFIHVTRPDHHGDWEVYAENLMTGETSGVKDVSEANDINFTSAFYGAHANSSASALTYAFTVAHPRFNLAKTPPLSYNITDQQVAENDEILFRQVGTDGASPATDTVVPGNIVLDHFDVDVQAAG